MENSRKTKTTQTDEDKMVRRWAISLALVVLFSLGGLTAYTFYLKDAYLKESRYVTEILKNQEQEFKAIQENPLTKKFNNGQRFLINLFANKEIKQAEDVKEQLDTVLKVQKNTVSLFENDIFSTAASDNYLKEKFDEKLVSKNSKLVKTIKNNKIRAQYALYDTIAKIQLDNIKSADAVYSEYENNKSLLPQYVVAISKIKNPNLKKAYQDKANVESTINVDDYVKSMLEEASAKAKEREEKESIQKQVNELKDTEQSLEREYISKANRIEVLLLVHLVAAVHHPLQFLVTLNPLVQINLQKTKSKSISLRFAFSIVVDIFLL